jgi:hypothetical protein
MRFRYSLGRSRITADAAGIFSWQRSRRAAIYGSVPPPCEAISSDPNYWIRVASAVSSRDESEEARPYHSY